MTLKVVSESRVTSVISVSILVLLGLSVLDYRPDVRDRQKDVRQNHRLMSPPIRSKGITMNVLVIGLLVKHGDSAIHAHYVRLRHADLQRAGAIAARRADAVSF